MTSIQTFDRALREVLKIEGGYVDNPNDSGGKTNYGITEATARAFGYTGPMDEMPLSVARDIYRGGYWDRIQLDRVVVWSDAVAIEMFDIAVNCGTTVAVRFLQRTLNVMNRRGEFYPDLVVDGLIGPRTLSALGSFMERRRRDGEVVLLRCLNSLQCVHYIELATRREKDQDFVYGWVLNRVELPTRG